MTRTGVPGYVGVELGTSAIVAMLTSADGSVRGQAWRRHPGPDYHRICRLIGELVAECRAGLPVLTLERAAVVTALPFDRQGQLLDRELAGRPLREDLRTILQAPVLLESRAGASALMEQREGAGQGARCLIWIGLGQRVSGAVVTDGSALTGAHGQAGELGHVAVNPRGPSCPCGARGCLDLYAGGAAIARAGAARVAAGESYLMAQLANLEAVEVTAEHVVEAARLGDATAMVTLTTAGQAIARAVASLGPVLDPDLVVLGGRLGVSAGELLLPVVDAELARRWPAPAGQPPVAVTVSALGPAAGLLGAAWLARSTHPEETLTAL